VILKGLKNGAGVDLFVSIKTVSYECNCILQTCCGSMVTAFRRYCLDEYYACVKWD
jgi:hypothetical protein